MVIFKSPDEYKPGDILIPHKLIRRRVKEVAGEISKKYKDRDLLVVGVLKGAFRLTSDLINDLHEMGVKDLHITFITVKSYPTGMVSENESKLVHEMDIHPEGRHVLVVDDILDTGKSLHLISTYIKSKGAKSVETFAFLDKPERRTVEFSADYVGVEIPNLWVQGYGMDTDEIGRAEPNIIVGPHRYK